MFFCGREISCKGDWSRSGDRGLARVLAPLAMSALSAALKIELKSWENGFENTYGRKPTPDDIRTAGLGTFKPSRPCCTTIYD